MNYRHAYHAGNFADVLKHTALVAILAHLRRKETPFAFIDTHAGRGLYDLQSVEAAKTNEAAQGYLRLVAEREQKTSLPQPLSDYCDVVANFPGAYPGSPTIAAQLLRAQDRLIAIEKHPDDADALRGALQAAANARVIEGDGYGELPALMPPRERRGLVLIDPPYENESEWNDATAALASGYRRFATGIYALWYPVKTRSAVNAGIGELLNAGIARLLQVELDIGADTAPPPNAEGQGPRLSATGLLIVNPPYGFAAAMEETTAFLAQALARGPGAKTRVEPLMGEV